MFTGRRNAAVALVLCAAAGCGEGSSALRYELRWCPHGEANCVLKSNEGVYVKGGYFPSLDSCNDAIRHLTYYGNKVGAACAEIPDWQRSAISGK